MSKGKVGVCLPSTTSTQAKGTPPQWSPNEQSNKATQVRLKIDCLLENTQQNISPFPITPIKESEPDEGHVKVMTKVQQIIRLDMGNRLGCWFPGYDRNDVLGL